MLFKSRKVTSVIVCFFVFGLVAELCMILFLSNQNFNVKNQEIHAENSQSICYNSALTYDSNTICRISEEYNTHLSMYWADGSDVVWTCSNDEHTISNETNISVNFTILIGLRNSGYNINMSYADGESISNPPSQGIFGSYELGRGTLTKLSTPIDYGFGAYHYKYNMTFSAVWPNYNYDLYFKFTLADYSFTYGSNNYDYGTVTSSKGNAASSDKTITVTSNSSFTLTASPKDGYEFKYWATSKTSTSSISTSATVTISGWPSSNLTYYAIFEEKPQEESTISFTLYPNRYDTDSSSTFKVVIPINGEIVAIGIDGSRYELSAGGSKTSSSIKYAANNSGNQLTISFKPSNYGSSSYYDIVIYYYKSS